MTDLVERLRSFINWRTMTEAADEIERLEAEIERLRAENDKLRKVIIRAKDALLDGQSAQWVHDILVAKLLGHKP